MQSDVDPDPPFFMIFVHTSRNYYLFSNKAKSECLFPVGKYRYPPDCWFQLCQYNSGSVKSIAKLYKSSKKISMNLFSNRGTGYRYGMVADPHSFKLPAHMFFHTKSIDRCFTPDPAIRINADPDPQ